MIGILAYLIVLQLLFPKWNVLGKTFTLFGTALRWIVDILVTILIEMVKLLGRLVEGFFGVLMRLFSRR